MIRTVLSRLRLVAALFVTIITLHSVPALAAPDTTAPTVGTVSPSTITVGEATALSASYSDTEGVVDCVLFFGGMTPTTATMTRSGTTSGTASYTATPTSTGTSNAYVYCVDAAGNSAAGATTSITIEAAVDTTAPTVSKVLPITATAGTATTITATFSDAFGVTSCILTVEPTGDGATMTLSGSTSGTASGSYTFAAAGTYSAAVRCADSAGNVGTGNATTITVTGVDTTAPTVGAISPTTATAGAAVTFSATFSDTVGVSECLLYIGGVSQGAMTLSGTTSGTASKSYTSSTVGSVTAQAKCSDAAGNIGTGSSRTVNINTDTTAPTVGLITPTTATAGTATTLSATYSDNVGVTGCTLYIGGVSQGAMTLSAGTASKSHTFSSTTYPSGGTSNAKATCVDASGNSKTGTVVTISISAPASSADTTAPTVGAPTPSTATEDVATTISATYSDAVGVSSCTLLVEGVSQGSMTLSSGTASKSYTFASADTYGVEVTCVDAAGNSTTSDKTEITATSSSSADTTDPTVSSVTPTTATAGSAVTLSATYSDAVGVTSCDVTIGSNSETMSLASGTATAIITFDTSGATSVTVSCEDAAGNKGTSITTVTVAAVSTDITAPTISGITPITATQDTAVTFTVTATDSSGMNSCHLYVDDSDQGAMTAGSSGAYTRSYTFASSGSHTAYASCGDSVGNLTTGTETTVTVAAAAASGTDTTAPTVSAISPSTATAGTAFTMSASVADSVGVTSCTLYVNSTNAGSMTISGGYATASYTFSEAGTGIANAYCSDAAGNATRGASTTFTIAAAAVEEEAVDEAEPGNLIKLACDSDSDVNDPCRAVYFYAEEDNKRHAFPNEKVYFGWYNDFDGVIVVTDEFMASITLGRNVTYKPGVTMVKFISVNTVYAVGESGELRAIDSEDTARSIWGSDWNTQIHDISDAFYSNYQFGEDIDSTSDYDPDEVVDVIDTIDQLLAARS